MRSGIVFDVARALEVAHILEKRLKIDDEIHPRDIGHRIKKPEIRTIVIAVTGTTATEDGRSKENGNEEGASCFGHRPKSLASP
jgi:hypothetical protein